MIIINIKGDVSCARFNYNTEKYLKSHKLLLLRDVTNNKFYCYTEKRKDLKRQVLTFIFIFVFLYLVVPELLTTRRYKMQQKRYLVLNCIDRIKLQRRKLLIYFTVVAR